MFLFGFLFICRNGLWCASDMQWLGLGVWGFSVDDDCVVLYSQRNKADLIKCSTNGKTPFYSRIKKSIVACLCHELGLLLCLSLTLCCTHTHTHTHAYRQTHTPTLSPTCLSSQSALALLCGDTCSHSHLIILSILQRLCLRFSV